MRLSNTSKTGSLVGGGTKTQWPFPTLEEVHSWDACYYGERGDWLIVYTHHRDSSILEERNWAAMLAELGGEGGTTAVERSGHWAVGWVEYLVLHPRATKKLRRAVELTEALEDYPVLDEEDLSECEYEAYSEGWDSWGRADYRQALKARLFDGDNEESDRLDELKEALDELSDEELDELSDEAAKAVNWEYQPDGDGVTINVSGLADCTNMDEVIALCDEVIAEERGEREIKKLAYYLGACPAQALEAVKLDLRTVSGVQALMQGGI